MTDAAKNIIEPLRDRIGRLIHDDPNCDVDWYSLSEERREPWRADADRIIAMLPLKECLSALESFASALYEWSDEPQQPDYCDIWEHPVAQNICLGDLRRAAFIANKLANFLDEDRPTLERRP